MYVVSTQTPDIELPIFSSFLGAGYPSIQRRGLYGGFWRRLVTRKSKPPLGLGTCQPTALTREGKVHQTLQSLQKAQRAAPRDSHCHAVQELLYCLAINGDSHAGIGIKGEFQTVEHTGLLTVLCRAVCIIFVPTKSGQKRWQVRNHSTKNWPAHTAAGHKVSCLDMFALLAKIEGGLVPVAQQDL